MTGMQGVTPNQLTLAKVDPTELDYWTLKKRIAELEAGGRPADEARAGLAHKISGPLSTLLMPLLAAVAAFGLARSGQVLLRAVIGMALGFAYFVVDNFSLAMGNAGTYPPVIAAWAPFLLFLLIGETVLDPNRGVSSRDFTRPIFQLTHSTDNKACTEPRFIMERALKGLLGGGLCTRTFIS